jgi:hypothetical protein
VGLPRSLLKQNGFFPFFAIETRTTPIPQSTQSQLDIPSVIQIEYPIGTPQKTPHTHAQGRQKWNHGSTFANTPPHTHGRLYTPNECSIKSSSRSSLSRSRVCLFACGRATRKRYAPAPARAETSETAMIRMIVSMVSPNLSKTYVNLHLRAEIGF